MQSPAAAPRTGWRAAPRCRTASPAWLMLMWFGGKCAPIGSTRGASATPADVAKCRWQCRWGDPKQRLQPIGQCADYSNKPFSRFPPWQSVCRSPADQVGLSSVPPASGAQPAELPTTPTPQCSEWRWRSLDHRVAAAAAAAAPPASPLPPTLQACLVVKKESTAHLIVDPGICQATGAVCAGDWQAHRKLPSNPGAGGERASRPSSVGRPSACRDVFHLCARRPALYHLLNSRNCAFRCCRCCCCAVAVHGCPPDTFLLPLLCFPAAANSWPCG